MSQQQIQKGLEGVIIDESRLSRVFGDEGRLLFRGYDIDDIAANGDFEETLYLMWHGELPTEEEYADFADSLATKREVPPEIMDNLVRTCAKLDEHPMNMLQSSVSALAGYDDNTDADFEEDLDAVVEMGASIAAKLPTLTAAYNRIRSGEDPIEPREDLSHAANFLYMLTGEEQPEPFVDAMDTALQIHMDHGANASTFTTRVISSTLANPYEAVAGGVGALSGPLHGGANQDVLDMLQDLDESGKPLPVWVDDWLDAGNVVFGWGHRVYNVKDPRAFILQDHAERLIDADLGDPKWYNLAVDLEEYLTDETDFLEKGIAPNVDYYSGTVYQQMNIPRDIYTNLFTMSRVGGWIGHIIEQYADNRIIRPRVKYVGDLDLEWTPMAER
ncbi:MAG: citrate/2-methylcitrate synthase [Halodesulfurarchaeum sp.]